MKKSAPAPPPAPRPDPLPLNRIGPSERLSATTAFSLILFGVLVLGVGFSQDDAAPVVPTLDVILTQTSTSEPPKQADFLAQANNQGGGDRDKAQRPREDQVGQVPKPQRGVAAQPLTAQAPPPAPEPRQRLLTTTADSALTPLPEEQPNTPPVPLPTGQEMIQRSIEMARLSASLDLQRELYAKRPKKKNITANTQEYEYAAYMRDWVRKVERIGTLNFPEEARRRNISGSVTMTVSVGRNGELKGVLINYSSGKRILDDAAVEVVNLASPFAPLPRTEENIDILDITRTWQFKNGNVDGD